MPAIAFVFPGQASIWVWEKIFMTIFPEQPRVFQVADEWAG